MKKRLLFVLATLLIFGSVKAQQQPTHYPFNYHDFPNTMTAIIQIQINGVEQTSSEFELGAFNGDMITGAERIGCYGSHGYYRVYLSVYGSSGSYEVTFKLYNHQTGEELDNYVITHQGEPYTFTWVSDTGIGSNKKPIVINFTTGQTFTKEITGYGNGNGNWYLIATPIDDMNPEDVDGMIADNANDYDFYWFDQTEELEWRSYKQGSFNLVSGMGYLYASKDNVTLSFSGAPVEGTSFDVSLVKDDDAEFPGWNLIGNPFTETAYVNRDFYVMNNDGNKIIPAIENGIPAMEGIFVIATEDGEELTFSTESPASDDKKIVLNMVQNRGSIVDRAIVRFDEKRVLPKFTLQRNTTKLYIPQDDKDYAVVYSEPMGVLPVNFEAVENGTYTFAVNVKGVEMQYLHLIDNMTGTDVDLLATPSYSFEALTTDYASRFKLVYSVCEDADDDNAFAFVNNGNIIINGDGMVQIFDMMGHVVASGDTKHSFSTSRMASGVYILRIVNGNDVKTQKIIIK